MKFELNLNEEELFFKNIYINRVKNKPIHPLEYSEFEDILEQLPMPLRQRIQISAPGCLQEETFFSDDMDIAVFSHLRYMPPHRHRHIFFEISYVLSGSCINYTDKEKLTLQKGDLYIIAPDTPHALWVCTDDTIVINILVRTSTFNQHFMNLLPDSNLIYHFFLKPLYQDTDLPYLLFKTGDDDEIYDNIIRIYQEYTKNKRYKNTMLTTMISYFFIILLRKHEQNIIIPTVKPSVMNETTIYILQYMQNNYMDLKLNQLAKLFNFSERQIQRIISTATGKSFSENILQLRMEHATELLKIPQLTIEEISHQLGYYDASIFRKTFKKYYGISLSEYRKRLKTISDTNE